MEYTSLFYQRKMLEQRITNHLENVLYEGVLADDAENKQWCLEEIASILGMNLPSHDKGIKPENL